MVYPITIIEGMLCPLAKIEVNSVTNKADAARLLGTDDLYDAEYHIIARPGTAALVQFEQAADPDLLSSFQIIRKDGVRGPKFVDDEKLDRQAMRGVCEITTESASILDRYLTNLLTTDRIAADAKQDLEAMNVEEENNGASEGAPKFALIKRYERKLENRIKAIEYHGVTCHACGFNFQEVYGAHGLGYIEVHHVVPISLHGEEVSINIKEDMAVLCANCHRMVHRSAANPLSLEQLTAIINAQRELEETNDNEE